ncbi:MAG: TonB-dependent receptor [Salinivirgaceae bacterium]|nr:TonB-dependent receptor [Salinivirgaceae bacterium]
MNKILTYVFLTLFSFSVTAQEKQITGKVTDSEGVGIPGVSVLIVGTSQGTITDLDGVYKISAITGVLRFSFIGYVPQEINVTGKTQIDVVLEIDTKALSEVVVIGYGTQLKKDLTTSVAIVGEDEIKERPMVSAAEALQGKAAGVMVIQPSGEPGTPLSVRVRGATSVLSGNEPIYVVDGIQTTDIKGLDPNDIATMTVLKDASSKAIYGARASNGVVIVTTKRGHANESNLNFNAYYGLSDIRKTIDVLNTKQYRKLMDEIGIEVSPSATYFNDWSEEVFGVGKTQSYQLSFSDGNEKSSYFLAASYLNNEGIVRPAQFDRYSIRLNIDNQIRPWLKVKTNVNLTNIKTQDTPDNLSSGRGGVIMSALNTPPFLHIYKTDGSGQFDPNPFQPSWENPVAYMEGADQEAVDKQIMANIQLEAKIVEGLFLKTNAAIDINNHQWDYYLDPFRTNYGRQNNGIGQSDKANSQTWMWENLLDYAKSINEHHFNGLLGSSVQRFHYNDSYLYGYDFPSDVSVTTLNAANVISGNTSIYDWALASFFGRVTYDFANKYYFTASLRRDGSSKLAHRWGTIPSFSAGWRISAEPFMQNISLINDLKIRGGWGMIGNQENIPNYSQYGVTSYYRQTPTNPLSGPVSVTTSYGNPDLRWETTAETSFGIDLSMLNSRITFTAEAYYKKTRDVQLDVQLPSTLQITSIKTNAGTIENKGFEFSLRTINTNGELNWNTDVTFSRNKNKVLELIYTDVYYYGRIYSNNQDVAIVREGLALGSFYGYISEGVNPETGDIIYKDRNENGIFDPNDRTVIGEAEPDFIFGITNTLSYKKFDLSIFFQGCYGNEVFNATRVDLEGMFDSKNQSTSVLRRWSTENRNTDIPRAVGGGNTYNVYNSSRFIEDGSYLRLKSLTLSYKALDNNPNFKAIKKLSFYVTGQNLLTLTNYSGFDPEVSAFGINAVTQGIDYGTYPQSRTIIFGLTVEF